MELNPETIITALLLGIPAVWLLLKYILHEKLAEMAEHGDQIIALREEMKAKYVHRSDLREELSRIEHRLETIEQRITEIYRILIHGKNRSE